MIAEVRRITRRRSSLKKRLALLFGVFATTMAILIGIYAVSMLRESTMRIASSNRASLELFASTLNSQMKDCEVNMSGIVLQSDAFRAMEEADNRDAAYLAGLDLRSRLDTLISVNSLVSACIAYSAEWDVYLGAYGRLTEADDSEAVEEKRSLQEYMTGLFNTGPIDMDRWSARKIGEHFYLIRVVRQSQVYLASMISLERVLAYAVQKNYIDGRIGFCLDNVLLAGKSVRTDGLVWRNDMAMRFGGTQYEVVVRQEAGGVTILNSVSYPLFTTMSGLIAYLIVFVAILVLAVLVILYYYVRRTVFRPLDSLIDTMKRIESGELTARSSIEYENQEFRQVNDTFNSMIDQISTLKIETYEKELEAERSMLSSQKAELEAQKSEMEALRMQIRPHFIENCLKNLYALVRKGQIDDVKAMILTLSQHLRFVLIYNHDTVDLAHELDMCRNYCDLSNIGQPEELRISYDQEIDAEAEHVQVPVVSLLSLIENSIKYRPAGERLEIHLNAHCLHIEDSSIVNISIHDSGNGFSEEQIAQLNEASWQENSDSHIGLSNTMNRFKLLYGDGFTAAFTNASCGGAQIELFVTCNSQMREERRT